MQAPANTFREKLIKNGERPLRPPSTNSHQSLGPRPSKPAPRRHPANRNIEAYKKRAGGTAEALLASWVFEPDSIFSVAAEELLAAKSRSLRYRWNRRHWLCRVLWEAAEFLNGAQVSELAGNTVEKLCVKAKIPRFAAKVIGRIASKVVDAALPGSPKQLADFLRVVVALICPDIDHCEYGTKAIDFLLKSGVEAALRDLTGTTSTDPINLPG